MKNNAVFVWVRAKATSEYSEWWIALASLFETVLFLPVDPFLIFFTLEQPKKYFRYAVVATVLSGIGGSIAYLIGAFFWHLVGNWIVGHLVTPAFFQSLVGHYHAHQQLVVFVGAFLPLPFKAITLSAGFCNISYVSFISALLFARLTRFYLVTWITYRWGGVILSCMDRYATPVVSLVCVKIAILIGAAYFFKS